MGAPVTFYWRKRIDNSRLVRQCDPAYRRDCCALLLGATVCLAAVLLTAWQHYEFIRAGYGLEDARSRYAQVLEWNRTLRLENAALLDPVRIDALARNRLGFEAPASGRVVPLGNRPAPAAAAAPVLARLDERAPAAPGRVSLSD
ncbi:MAG: hypothetical protein ACE5HB_05180 [Terriglobia bacterium]